MGKYVPVHKTRKRPTDLGVCKLCVGGGGGGGGGGVVKQKCKQNIKKNNVKFVLKLSKIGAMQKVSDSDSCTFVIF